MIDKLAFKRTETRLYNYFRKDKIIFSLQNKIKLLKSQIETIDNKLKNIDIDIPEESHQISYEARIQTTVDNTSYAERTTMRITEKLLQEKGRKEEEIQETESEIMNLEVDNVVLDSNINGLATDDIEFLRAKYSNHIADWEIAQDINLDRTNVNRKKQRLINKISDWETFQKNVSH